MGEEVVRQCRQQGLEAAQRNGWPDGWQGIWEWEWQFAWLTRHEGLREDLLESLAVSLELKFSEAGKAFLPELANVSDHTILLSVQRAILDASVIDDLRKLIKPTPSYSHECREPAGSIAQGNQSFLD